jgi:hypothetical protein
MPPPRWYWGDDVRLHLRPIFQSLSVSGKVNFRDLEAVGADLVGSQIRTGSGAPKAHRIPLITVALQVAELRMACRGRPFPVSLPAIGLLLSVLGLTYLSPSASSS